MKADVYTYLHTRLVAATPASADYYPPDRAPDLATHLSNGRTWVKLYAPTEDGDAAPVQHYSIIVDVGNISLEAARSVAEGIRASLDHALRAPSPFRRQRIVALDEGSFHRVQFTYRLQRAT
ncbi:MAG: hypothetical protein H0U69_03710 [Trueperaceae bacterium]|nr:hypothetical protein [Trueperaceae bacterium]